MGLPSRRVNWWPQIFQLEGLPGVALHKQEDAGFGLDCVYSNRHAGTLQQAYRSEQTNRACRTEKKRKKKPMKTVKKKEAHCRFHTARGGQDKQDEAVRRHVVQKTPVTRLWNRDSRGEMRVKTVQFSRCLLCNSSRCRSPTTSWSPVWPAAEMCTWRSRQRHAVCRKTREYRLVWPKRFTDWFKKCLKMTYTFCPLYSYNQCFWDRQFVKKKKKSSTKKVIVMSK